MHIYVAAPLFNPSEREFNLVLDAQLRDVGFSTFLPQRDGELSYNSLKEEKDVSLVRRRIFQKDVDAIKHADILVAVLDGRVPGEGVCVEVGMAHALGKICVALKTHARVMDMYGDSLMLDGCFQFKASTFAMLVEWLSKNFKNTPVN